METRFKVLKFVVFIGVFPLFFLCELQSQNPYSGLIQMDTLTSADSVFILRSNFSSQFNISLYSLPDGKIIDRSKYIYRDSTTVVLQDSIYFGAKIEVRKYILPDTLNNTLTWLDTTQIKSDYLIRSIPTDLRSSSAFPEWSDITYTGQFGRGISIGNTQNATLNSNFDLQLKGTLPNDVEVLGSLSDNSIPLQPDGNSLQIQEFDRVFIQLRKKGMRMVAGDHEIRNPNHYFMKYYKKTKGVFASYNGKLDNGWEQYSEANFSTSKGKFQRITLEVEEGIQGPYRLTSRNNSLFAVVLAGTERVYVDGKLLTRGQLNDYTIDYNLGEVTFSPKIYISARSRVIVEYEYAEQNYLRSVLTGHTEWKKNGWELGVDFYSEQDGKNSFQNDILTPENEAILAEAGDHVEMLKGSSIVPWEEPFEEGVVLYHIIDSMGYNDVLVTAKSGNAPLYTASFSFVGTGVGNYVKSNELTNGERFVWVEPNPDGTPNGDYAPTTNLQAPQLTQMYALRTKKNWGAGNYIFSEWSLTREDLNRFSDIGSGDDFGLAQASGFSIGKQVDSAGKKEVRIEGIYEWKSLYFNPVSPYRPVEFQRNWNFSMEEGTANETLIHLSAKYSAPILNSNYELDYFSTGGGQYNGWKHLGELTWTPGSFTFFFSESLLLSESTLNKSVFSRPYFRMGWKPGMGNWGVEGGYEGEYNAVNNQIADTLTASSIRFDRFYLKSKWDNNNEITYSHRIDYLNGNDGFRESFNTDDISLSTTLQNGERNYFKLLGTLRHLKIIDSGERSLEEKRGWNILGQLQFSQNPENTGLQSTGELSLGNGKEPRRSFQYLKVETGNGQYKFVDLNNDSIQQLNEFFPALYPDERNYIRVNVVQNELISTFNYNFRWSLNFRTEDISDHQFWSKWATENSFRIENKQQKGNRIRVFDIPDSSLITSQVNVLSNVYFNRTGRKFQQHFGYWIRNQKSFLNSGFEKYSSKDIFSKTTIGFSTAVNTLIEVNRRLVAQRAENFTERNFEIGFWDLGNTFRWLVGSKMQLELENGIIIANAESGEEKSNTWKNKLSWQFRPDLKWSFQSSFDYSRVKYDYEEVNLSLEQVMLDGLRDGQNLIWEANIQRRLPNNLVITLRYNGRKIGDGTVVHSGTVQANLLF